MTQVSHQQWGQVPGLGSMDMWTLQSPQVRVEVLTLGAIIRSVSCRGKHGQMEDVVLGYDDLEAVCVCLFYEDVSKGRFIFLSPSLGFSVQAVWLAEEVEGGVILSHTSPDGDQGYPGELQVSVSYTLQGETLTTDYRARSTKTTPINLTNHSYFNLAGQGVADIYDHEVSISAHSYLPVDDTSIPTGEIRPVKDTPFDLRVPVPVGVRLKNVPGLGFDHNFCLCSPRDDWTERHAARVLHPPSGRVLEVSTTQPGVQFYTANVLDGSIRGKGGVTYGKHSAFCLETQNWPNAVNQASFPDCLLRPGDEYHHVTRFTFTTV
uniref:Galactose mutarotase n=1 Tax=Poecilia reticulata TaxID=8081 RepID=A0A3P9NLA8_POERE